MLSIPIDQGQGKAKHFSQISAKAFQCKMITSNDGATIHLFFKAAPKCTQYSSNI